MNYADLVNVQQLLIKHKKEGSPEDVIEDDLYQNWFHAGLKEKVTYPHSADYDACLCQALEYDKGWIVERSRLPGLAGAVQVRKGDCTRYVAPPFVAPSRSDSFSFERGDEVYVCPLEAQEISGFWHVFSSKWIANGIPEKRQRLYFNVKSGLERKFVNVFCSKAEHGDSWSLKILCGQSEGPRQDIAVAYLPRDLSTQDGWLGELLSAITALVDGVGPPLTKQLHNGIHWAPDISSKKSFGQVLCRTLMTVADQNSSLDNMDVWLSKSREALNAVVLGAKQ